MDSQIGAAIIGAIFLLILIIAPSSDRHEKHTPSEKKTTGEKKDSA
jgi:hypothetical protein